MFTAEEAWLEAQAEGLNLLNLLASQWGDLFTNVGDLTGRVGVVEDDTIVYVGTDTRGEERFAVRDYVDAEQGMFHAADRLAARRSFKLPQGDVAALLEERFDVFGARLLALFEEPRNHQHLGLAIEHFVAILPISQRDRRGRHHDRHRP